MDRHAPEDDPHALAGCFGAALGLLLAISVPLVGLGLAVFIVVCAAKLALGF